MTDQRQPRFPPYNTSRSIRSEMKNDFLIVLWAQGVLRVWRVEQNAFHEIRQKIQERETRDFVEYREKLVDWSGKLDKVIKKYSVNPLKQILLPRPEWKHSDTFDMGGYFLNCAVPISDELPFWFHVTAVLPQLVFINRRLSPSVEPTRWWAGTWQQLTTLTLGKKLFTANNRGHRGALHRVTLTLVLYERHVGSLHYVQQSNKNMNLVKILNTR